MKLAILGPPGSGKGTHTAKIAKRYNLKHVVVGDIVKQEIRDKTELGKVMFEYTNVGKFVPSDIVMQVLAKQVENLVSLIDGYAQEGHGGAFGCDGCGNSVERAR